MTPIPGNTNDEEGRNMPATDRRGAVTWPSGITVLAALLVVTALNHWGLWCAIGFLLIYMIGRSQHA